MSNDWSRKPHNEKTVIYVVRVDDYQPDLCELTLRNLKLYAEKIGADFVEINERKFPDFPATYEKLQVHDLGRDNEWNILIDADFLLHPMTPDFRTYLSPNMVGIDYGYDASSYLDTSDKYFLRDGRNRGIATGLVVTNNVVHDLWTPLEFGWEEARTRLKREFIVDEYCLSRNLAKFGLKYVGLFQEEPESREEWFIHLGSEEKSESERKDIILKAGFLMKEWGQI